MINYITKNANSSAVVFTLTHKYVDESNDGVYIHVLYICTSKRTKKKQIGKVELSRSARTQKVTVSESFGIADIENYSLTRHSKVMKNEYLRFLERLGEEIRITSKKSEEIYAKNYRLVIFILRSLRENIL